MIEKKEVEILRDKLIKIFGTNYIGKVAIHAGTSRPTASKFFNFKNIRYEKAALLYDSALELIEEQTNKQESRSRKAQQLLGDKPQTSLNLNS